MFVVGLTGGIGSGKSTAVAHFRALGVPVVDADELARELTAPGQPALAEIAAAFGPGLIDDHGRLDRPRLRRLIFAAPAQRRRLETILHPPIRRLLRERLAASEGPYAVACIPLLVETGQRDLVDRVLVIDVPEDLQYERLRRRGELAEGEIDAMIRSQAGRETRLAAADDVVVNTGSIEALQRRIDTLDRTYRRLAAGAK